MIFKIVKTMLLTNEDSQTDGTQPLQDYLETLNSTEQNWGIWVDPENPEQNYRVGQTHHAGGGISDDKVFIGTLAELSFGFQSELKAWELLASQQGIEKESANNMWQEWKGTIPEKYKQDIADITNEWAKESARLFISDELPEILAQAENLEN
ncbi:MAG TPA: hypothetical protein V6D27_01220 [Vampirovibrionales bacterium]